MPAGWCLVLDVDRASCSSAQDGVSVWPFLLQDKKPTAQVKEEEQDQVCVVLFIESLNCASY